MRDDACYHVPTAPGQAICTCLDELMWLRLLVELQARRIAQLEHHGQQHPPVLIDPGVDPWAAAGDVFSETATSTTALTQPLGS